MDAFTPTDRLLAIRTLLGEAANEPIEGQVAVAHVIRNRVNEDGFPGTVAGVVRQPKQFSPWNDANGIRHMMSYAPESPAFQRAAMVVDSVFGGEIPDITNGATHFAQVETSDPSNQRGWIADMQRSGTATKIGAHTFGRPGSQPGRQRVAGSSELPAGFKLVDDAKPNPSELPPGFRLVDDPPPAAPAAVPAPAGDRFAIDAPEAAPALRAGLEARAATMRPSIGRSAALGTVQGGLANFADEAASGVNAAVDYATGQAPNGLGAAYNARLASARRQLAEAQAANPKTFLAGEVGGGLATAALLPGGAVAEGATLANAARAGAGAGAAYGALSGAGAGEDLMGRAGGAAVGGALGAATGAAAPYAIAGLQAAGRGAGTVANNVMSPVRAAMNPEQEAARRVGAAFTRDNSSLQAAAEGVADAQRAGAPVVLGDVGGQTVHALARSASNTSPEARTALTKATDPRFETQTERLQALLGKVGAGDKGETLERLQQEARKANKPAYDRAYAQGERGVWDEDLATLAAAPAVQDAIKGATKTGANRAAAEGFRPVRNPFKENADGDMILSVQKDGSQATPTLQFWDHVKRNLDDAWNAAKRRGEKEAAADINDLRSQLVSKLDEAVPAFAEARAGAARYFGAQDALEAGRNLLTTKFENADVARGIAKMSEPERALLAHGFASELSDRIAETGNRRSVLNSLFLQSPAAKQRIEMALGKDKAAAIEAHLRVEGMMDEFRRAVSGNSTTARQLAEAGLAGGVGTGLLTGDWSPGNMSAGALLGGLARGGKIKIDARVAQKVGEMLSSDSPETLAKVAGMVRANPSIRNAIRDADSFVAKFLGIAEGQGAQGANTALLGGMRGASAGQPQQDDRR